MHSALNASENIYEDSHCCETKLWVDRISSPEFKDWKSLMLDPLLETLDSKIEGLAEIRSPKDNRYGILFRRVPSEKMAILFTPFKDQPPSEMVKKRYPDLLAQESPAKETVLRKTKRAYPHELVLNEQAWLDVQSDADGNMALSMEEIAVLQSARNSQGGFPLFINGSAGSGKSTI